MKNIFITFLMLMSFGVLAQDAPLSPKVTIDNEYLSINYNAPSMRGRVIFGDLVPYGQVWRTGANQATQVTFKNDVNFGGQAVKAGTYSLFTIPNEKEWTVILNTDLTQWGAFGYDDIKDKNIAEVNVSSSSLESPVERMEIDNNAHELWIAWEKTKVIIPLKF